MGGVGNGNYRSGVLIGAVALLLFAGYVAAGEGARGVAATLWT